MSKITNIDLSAYRRFADGNSLPAATFNSFVKAVEDKTNEIIGSIGGASSTGDFYVNGVKTTPNAAGNIVLAAKGKYVLSGVLNGRIDIGTPSDSWGADEKAPTQIVLDGVTITTDSESNSAIFYVPESDKLIVTVAKNTKNYIVCTHEAERADSQHGAIHCENDMIIQGSGYLTVVNKGGHGIKASELRLSGNPHIYVEAIHDGIHGNKMLLITGGVYYVNKANDAFGTRAQVGSYGNVDYKAPGKIWIFGGEFFAYNIGQAVFDSKAKGYIFCKNQTMNIKLVPPEPNTLATGVTLHTDVAAEKQYVGMSNVDPETYFGEPVVTGMTLEGDTYTGTSAAISIQGYFKDKKFVFPINKSTITLNDTYIETSVGNAMEYTYADKNVQFNVESEQVVIIRSSGEGKCICSSENINIEPKNNSVLYVESECGMDIDGSNVTIRQGYGSVVAKGTVSGSAVIFGETGKEFGGALQAGKIIGRLSSKGQKGNVTATTDIHIGHVYADEIYVAGGGDFGTGYGVDYHKVSGSTIVGDKGRAIEPYDVVTADGVCIPTV